MKVILFLSLLALSCYATTPRSAAKITSLPGLDTLPSFDMFSGYVTLNKTEKNMFYWFVEAAEDAENKPVALWLQGGPGCSGLGGGFFEENGPFYTEMDGDTKQVKLRDAFYSWNRLANMIYIESPIGVGFSYSDNPRDYNTNDNITAVDNMLFLEGFFEVYPEFANNDFWIVGESYAGVYIPTLSYEILKHNPKSALAANLKKGGLMLGNPVTGCDGKKFDGEQDILALNTEVANWYYHAMVSPFNYYSWVDSGCDTAKPPSISKCFALYDKVSKGVGTFVQPLKAARPLIPTEISPRTEKKVNPDALYYSFCTGNVTLEFDTASNYECFSVGDQIKTYLNQDDVATAIHAKKTQWSICGGPVNYRRNVGNLMPYLRDLFSLAPDMRVLYYAGDIDIATVPFPQTARCLMTLDDTVVQPWRPWVYRDEVAGYVEVYSQFTLATLKGAGHEAPAYQPAAAFTLFESFLLNQSFPN